MTHNTLNFKNLLEKYGDIPALVWAEGKLSYHQYFQQIIYVSDKLRRKGIQSGSRIAVISDIDYHFPILFFAILNVGGIVVPLNPKVPKKKIKYLLTQVGCEWLIAIDRSFSSELDGSIKLLDDIYNFDIQLESGVSINISPLPLTREATIIFTSGSALDQKGVLHSIENHYYSALGSNENIPLNSDDCWMVSLPFFHVAGIAILFRTLICGATCYIPDMNDQLHVQITKFGVSHLSLVSTQLYRWLQELITTNSVASLKAVLLGGSQISPAHIQHGIKSNLPLYTSYGSTEMSSQITTTSGDDLKNDPHSSGKLLSYREMKIDDTGEILVKGKTLCKGYVSGRELTPCSDNDGWYHTEDLGYIDENQNLIVTGRLDNMFVSGGENINPEEIERHLQYHNKIIDVCVVEVFDSEYGARPVAFVKLADDETLNETDLTNYLRDKIAAFKIPNRFFTWPADMERLKPDRKYLRQLADRNMKDK